MVSKIGLNDEVSIKVGKGWKQKKKQKTKKKTKKKKKKRFFPILNVVDYILHKNIVKFLQVLSKSLLSKPYLDTPLYMSSGDLESTKNNIPNNSLI